MAGLSKPTVSTGKPMNKLHGATKYTAQLSNIGGGLKTTGGKGIDGVLDTVIKHTQARTAKAIMGRKSRRN